MSTRPPGDRCDVIVVGGGFAGVTAARDLGQRGYRVLLLEARDRLGGRTWYRRFADSAQMVEFGGTWLARRWQPQIAREIERYNLPIIESPAPASLASLVAGRRLTGLIPVPMEEIFDLERVWYQLIHASHRLDADAPLVNPPDDLDIPFTEFLKPLALPPATYDYVIAWVIGAFGCDAAQVSTVGVLSWIAAYDHSVIAVHLGESEMFAHGTSSAIAAIIADSGAEVRLETPVRRIAQDDRGVSVTTQAGETYTARAAVVALPLNVLGDVEFSPGLGAARRQAAAEGHCGHATKVWALVQGAPPYFLGAGLGPGLVWLGTQRELPEGSLMVGFGPGPGVLDVHSVEAIQRNVDAFVPGAEVVRIDAHDWSADPYSKGAWASYRPGQLTRYGAALRAPEGRLAFATSDIATKWAGWMEGAINSGSAAAEQVAALLARDKV